MGVNRRNFERAFTLVELMVVILIVGILAAVVIPILRGRIDSAKWAEGKSMMGSIATAICAYCTEKGPTGAPPTLIVGNGVTALGFDAADLQGTYFVDTDFSMSVTSMGPPPVFTVTCTPAGRANRPSNPATYVLNGLASGEMTWTP